MAVSPSCLLRNVSYAPSRRTSRDATCQLTKEVAARRPHPLPYCDLRSFRTVEQSIREPGDLQERRRRGRGRVSEPDRPRRCRLSRGEDAHRTTLSQLL